MRGNDGGNDRRLDPLKTKGMAGGVRGGIRDSRKENID